MTDILIEICGHTLRGRLGAGTAATALVSQLPVTVSVRDFGSQELIGPLPAPLDVSGEPAGRAAPTGTIGYWVPDSALVLYYADVARYRGIVPMGTFDGASILPRLGSPVDATIRRA